MNQNLNTGHLQHQQHQYSHSQQQQQHISQTTAATPEGPSPVNDNVLVYINHTHGGPAASDDNPNRSGPGGMTLHHNCSSWAKHPSSPANNVMSSTPPIVPNNNSCPSSSTVSSYGAYSHSQETGPFYPGVEHFPEENTHGHGQMVEGRPCSSSPNFNSNSNAGFYSNDTPVSGSDYYQNQNPGSSNQFQSFEPKSECGTNSSNSVSVNFFSCNNNSGFYPQQQQQQQLNNHHHYNHHTDFHSHSSGKYFRNNYNSSNHHLQQLQDSTCSYFGDPPTQSRVGFPSYGHGHPNHMSDFHSDNSNSPQPMPMQPTYRRNSIESFSSEPGELGSYNSKYGSMTTTFNSSQFQLSHSKRFVPGSSGGGSWSNESAQGHSTCQGYFFSSQSQNQQPSSSSGGHRHYVANNSANSSNFEQQCSGNGGYPQPQQQQQFVQNSFSSKNCPFESTEIGSGVYRAAPLKHRSLSLQYPRSDQLFQRMFHLRTHQHQSNNYSSNTNKSVPVLPEIPSMHGHESHCCSSGSQCCGGEGDGENDSGVSADSNSGSPELNHMPAASDRTNFGSGNDENPGDDDEDEDEDEPSDPMSQSNLNNENDNNSEESSSSSTTGCDDSIGNPEEDLNNKDDVISTRTSATVEAEAESSSSTCHHQVQSMDCDDIDMSGSVENDNELSNSSSLALLDSLTLMNTLAGSPLSDNGDGGLSGMSSESGDGIGHRDKSPQKILKRSFSEADKDLVINTSAITAAMAFGILREIPVPVGWKRELNNNSNQIVYISPSATKLRSWDEVKNYVSSDGTCKCGLSCPLWLEHTFSFDPKVRNACEEEEENLDRKDVKMKPRFSCSHKRKTPSSEDYPLISSTRDDLGDFGEQDERKGKSLAKKRRISGAHDVCLNDEPNTSNYKSNSAAAALLKPSSPTSGSQNVSVPFSQQSPDTTTQTPQRDMSPASSVSSEPSFTSSGGNRSANTTPTPANGSLKGSPPKGQGSGQGQNQYEFAWPTAPTTTSNERTPTPPLPSRNLTKKAAPGSSPSSTPKSCTGIKPRGPPCPNIDVRQIPLEQNLPPPRPNQMTTAAATAKESPAVTAATGPSTMSLHSASSQLHQNQPSPTVSFIPVTSGTATASAEQAIAANLNTGYSISPVIPNTVNVSLSSLMNNSTYQFANILPMQMQMPQQQQQQQQVHKIVNTSTGNFTTGNMNMLIPQSLARSITISMVEQQQEKNPSPSPSSSTSVNLPSSSTSTSLETQSTADSLDKSPLQLVQDVVDRFHGAKPGESGGTSNLDGADNASTGSESQSVSTTADVSKNLNQGEIGIVKDELKTETGMNPLAAATSTVQLPKTMAITSSATLISLDGDTELCKAIDKLDPNLPSISIFPASESSSSISIQPVASSSGNNSAITSACITTTSMSTNVPIMAAHAPLLNNGNGGFNLANALNAAGGNSLILDQNNQNSLFATATSTGGGGQSLRYPVFQTLQPIILNSNGTQSSLIISPQSQGEQGHSFIQIDQNNPHHQATAEAMMQSGATTTTTMVIDPSSLCGGMGQSILCSSGPKKKKKRLSKKQQQQQAQLQLQQQLLLQQLHQQVQAQQVQAAAQQQLPLLFPQSFSLGQQGFSLQPMNMNMNMNFFPTPTILTLPNIILNPADGTLFIQQPSGTPLSTTAAATPTNGGNGNLGAAKMSNQFPIQTLQPQQQQQNLIAPKKENGGIVINEGGGGLCSDDSRQNATPDSSTNDCQLGLIASTTPNPTNSITVSLPLSSSTNLQQNKKLPLKSKTVSSSSSTVKRILPQKQILPKIDSTTRSTGENT